MDRCTAPDFKQDHCLDLPGLGGRKNDQCEGERQGEMLEHSNGSIADGPDCQPFALLQRQTTAAPIAGRKA